MTRYITRQAVLMLLLGCVASVQGLAQVIENDSILREMIRTSGQARVMVPFPGPGKLNELSAGFSIAAVNPDSVLVVISPLTVEMFISGDYNYRLIENTDSKGIVNSSCISDAKDWDSYPTYSQYDSIMRSFATSNPDLCRLDTIGVSIYGKLILALKISDNVTVDEDEPETFFSSTIHGDETGGFVLMLHLADYLLENYPTDNRIARVVDNLELWINPLANPDGTYRQGNTISTPTRFNANGYDLNRNFPDPETPNTVKQPETLDMIKFMRNRKFIISANFHSGTEVVNYPWDRWSRLHADDEWFYNISRKYADTVHLNAIPGYMTFLDDGVTNGYQWYKINGSRQDFVTWEIQGREVTIELDNNFVTPAGDLNALWQFNRSSMLGYLENALQGVHGTVKDMFNGEPVAAKIFIAGHDTDSSHVYSDTLTGNFTRLLSPGQWDLTFSATGYYPREEENVSVSADMETRLDVMMEPIFNPLDTIPVYDLYMYPNPSSETMRVRLPEWQEGTVNVRIYNSRGMKVADYFERATKGVPLKIAVSNLPAGFYVLVTRSIDYNITDRAPFVVTRR